MPDRISSAAKCSRCGLTNCSCVGGYGGPLRPTPSAATVERTPAMVMKVRRLLDEMAVRDDVPYAVYAWAEEVTRLVEKDATEPTAATRRLRECVERWPECESGAYDPRCCRFPKSCSCTSTRTETDWRLVFKRGDELLEVSVPEDVWRAFDATPAPGVDSDNIDGYDEGLPE